MARGNSAPGPGDVEALKGLATESLAQQKQANTDFVNSQKQGALITAAKREAAALAQNPRMVGPGSEIAQGLAKIRAAISGQPPDSLVDLGGLDKMLLQMGAQNVRSALEGQKITQQEFLLMLGKGNPNTDQPLATINKLLDYFGAQNEYDGRFARTKQAALERGANPMTVDSEIGSRADRGDFIEGKVGVRPPVGGGKSSGPAPSSAPTITSQAQYDALPKGAHYVDSNGKPHVKGGK